MLELLVAVALSLLDRGAGLGVGGEQRRLGPQRSSSRAIWREPWTFLPSSLIAGTVTPGKPTARTAALETTGIRSVRSYSIPLYSSISAAAAPGWEPGIV